MKLFGSFTSPFVRHCRIALMSSGLQWSMQDTDYASIAKLSPTKKVPYFSDADIALTDSSSILKYIREKAGVDFLPQINDYELYCMVNTAMDAAINLFILEMDGLGKEQSAYLKRQSERIDAILAVLDSRSYAMAEPFTDGEIRLACFLDWGLYRKRFSLQKHENLQRFLARVRQWPIFKETAPPPL